MFPIISILGKDISTYAIFATAGLLIAGFVFCYRINRGGYDENEAILFLLAVSAGMLVGGHLLYGITNFHRIPDITQISGIKGRILFVIEIFNGSVFYGGLIGAYIFGSIYIKKRCLPRNIYLDNCALFGPLFHAFARIGCFFGGCCYGIESNFGFCAPENAITAIGDARRFPVQLLEAMLNAVIALIIIVLLKRKRMEGKLFYVYLSLYSFVRFFDEFLRGDEIRGFVFSLSTSQFISILVELFALTMLFIPKKENAKV